jgi:hypothetical protein
MMYKMILAAALSLTGSVMAQAQDAGAGFFITSANPGQGADLGGLEGADAYCTTLAEAAGITGKTWAAYLSSSAENARHRIGSGPWMNVNGVVIAQDVDQLHSEDNNLTKDTALTETGQVINGRGDTPNRHDVMTGSDLQGMLEGNACEDWTTSGEGSVMVGHHDRTGGGDHPTAWNSAHPSAGCGMEALQQTGGDGLFYCFATN